MRAFGGSNPRIKAQAKRIAYCGLGFLVGLITGYFVGQALFRGEVYWNQETQLVRMIGVLLGVAVVIWLFGCVFSLLLVVIDRFIVRWTQTRLLLPIVGASIAVTPYLTNMFMDHVFFFAKDEIILGVAGLATGVAVAWSRPDRLLDGSAE